MLPINLDVACEGVSCQTDYTCVAGRCVPQLIDDCDGGTCTTNSDAGVDGALVDVSLDGIVSDAPSFPDAIADAGCGTGICTLASLTGSCLAVGGGFVYVVTSAGIAKIPTTGGAFTNLPPNGTPSWVASSGTDLASGESHDAGTWTVTDLGTKTSFSIGTMPATVVAMSTTGIGVFSKPKGEVLYQPLDGGPPTKSLTFGSSVLGDVAVARDTIYATVNGVQLCRVIGTQSTCIDGGTLSPSTLVVDDPSVAKPAVYVVQNQTNILQLSSDLTGTPVLIASGGVGLAAIAYDVGPVIYAIATGTGIVKTFAGTFASVVSTPNIDPRCVAVDATSVYWVGTSGGVFKHPK